MSLPDDFVASQSSLQDYTDCARHFELRYLEKVRYPAPQVDDMLAFEQRTQQGARFHHLVHQHLVGIPADLLQRRTDDDPDLARWFAAYLQNGLDDVPPQRFPERTLSASLDDVRLIAKFDLVALAPERAVIVDWKTSRYLPDKSVLTQRMQTIVYRYLLARAGAAFNAGQPILPEQVEMIYWYADHDGKTIRLPYDAEQFRADEAFLRELLTDIQRHETFPLTDDERKCRFCTYRSLCDRGVQAGALVDFDAADYEPDDLDDLSIDLDQIAEIEF